VCTIVEPGQEQGWHFKTDGVIREQASQDRKIEPLSEQQTSSNVISQDLSVRDSVGLVRTAGVAGR